MQTDILQYVTALFFKGIFAKKMFRAVLPSSVAWSKLKFADFRSK